MGFSASPKILAGKTARMALAAADTPKKATLVAGEAAATIIRGVSPSHLRNVGKAGADLNVRVFVTGSPMNAVGRVLGTGPWQIIEYDTKPHPIPRLKGSRSRRTGFTRQFGPAFGGVNEKRLRMPDGSVRRQVFHPGTSGQLPFHKGAAIARPLIPKVYQFALASEMTAIF